MQTTRIATNPFEQYLDTADAPAALAAMAELDRMLEVDLWNMLERLIHVSDRYVTCGPVT